ncbi:hypothetical protein [Haladaptatus sp. DYSN1]|uniref:hypothetical protein n=1 Tax=unclassified Haladaptatus TaxID=2622732 RepID=UPI002405F8E0|nr:hypothetical protein [Haladaptatus sp. DYSN1]
MPSHSRRTVLRLSVVSLATGFAGCSFTGPSATDTPSPETSETPTEEPTETKTTQSGNTVEYAALTEQDKELFDEMRSQAQVTRGMDRVSETLLDAEFVVYQGSRYRIEKENAGYIAEYTLEVTKTSESNVEEDELVAYEDLTPEAAAAFDEARTGDRFTVRGETLPGGLAGHRYVEFDGEYYELTVIVGDIIRWRFAATKVEERVARGS